MIFRCILPSWASEENPQYKKVIEGDLNEAQIRELNLVRHYNIYYLPNSPSNTSCINDGPIDGSNIDLFHWIFVDMDLKDGTYPSKEAFISVIGEGGLPPTKVVDSGNGIHVYWRVSNLDAISFLRLQRRLIRKFRTDEAVAKIYQLMRYPGTVNTKLKDAPKECDLIYEDNKVYTCEELSTTLPPISLEDEQYCQQHFDKTYNIAPDVNVDDKIPPRFDRLVRNNKEVRDIWAGKYEDRSKADFRLGHLMHADGFSKDEALSVLVNSAKASQRAPKHRVSYAQNIVDKFWTYNSDSLSKSVKEILETAGDRLKGTKFPCWPYIDATTHGFRLGQVVGLVAGSGVGKTAMALNMFEGFVKNNPEYDHFFIPLEQPANEIADRWKTMCGSNTALHSKVHVLSNYDDAGAFRHLSFEEIKKYLLEFRQNTGKKIGCVVIDHIGALKKKGKDGENQDLMDICHAMKGFAVETNTMLVMQSQTSREKAGIGDLELNKDAAYGTVYFESYCDFLITIWQPLKRCYSDTNCPTVTAFKFCKIRHKKTSEDNAQEDVPYLLYFDSHSEHLRELTEQEEISFDYFNKQATNKRKGDRKTDIVTYHSIKWTKGGDQDGGNHKDSKDGRAAS